MKIPFSDLEVILREGRPFLGKDLMAMLKNKIGKILSGVYDPIASRLGKTAHVKKAGIGTDALMGALLAGGTAAIPAALYAYSEDQPIGKTLAKAESFALPIGAAMGTMGFPASRAMGALTNLIGNIPGQVEALTPKIKDALMGAKASLPSMSLGNLRESIKDSTLDDMIWLASEVMGKSQRAA